MIFSTQHEFVAGSFEIALLRLCRAYDLATNSVIFGSAFVPLDAFINLSKYLHDVILQTKPKSRFCQFIVILSQ